jgi:hypothetical protein
MIVGTELALHREVLAGTLGHLRPGIPMHMVRPDQDDGPRPCEAPRLVIASDREMIERLQPFAWILLFPDDADLAIVSVGGNIRTIANASIEDLVAVIDEAWPSSPHMEPAEPTRG